MQSAKKTTVSKGKKATLTNGTAIKSTYDVITTVNKKDAEYKIVKYPTEDKKSSSKKPNKAASAKTGTVRQPVKRPIEGGEPSAKQIAKYKTSLDIPVLKKINGTVFVIGENDVGQLGLGESVEVRKRPSKLELPYNVVDIVAGGMHSVCLLENGEVLTFGCNDEGALGRITEDDQELEHTPTKVAIPEKVVKISAGDSHSACLTESGCVYIWGNFRNSQGSLGLTVNGVKQIQPLQILHGITIVKISSGTEHLTCLSNLGILYTLGCGENGQLGRLSCRTAKDGGRKGLRTLLEPDSVPITRTIVAAADVYTGSYNTFFKAQNTGSIYAFGLNNYNQLGRTNTNDNEPTIFSPEMIHSFEGKKWLDISGGQHHTLALDEEGKVYALGRSDYGRLGLGKDCYVTDRPTVIPTLESWRCSSVSCGNLSSFSVTATGSAYSWGFGTNHQLGHGNDEDCFEPCEIDGNFSKDWKVVKVSGGGQHTLLLAVPRTKNQKKQTDTINQR